MSTDTDEYWVGALAAAAAVAHAWLLNGRPDLALNALDYTLERFAESPVLDPLLRAEIYPYWKPKQELMPNDDSDVLRPLRTGNPDRDERRLPSPDREP